MQKQSIEVNFKLHDCCLNVERNICNNLQCFLKLRFEKSKVISIIFFLNLFYDESFL